MRSDRPSLSTRPAASSCASFFFQAEDGIRDTSVTGVQTCALPISPAAIKQWDHAHHVDDPLPSQYLRWLTGMLHGDPGETLAGGRSIGTEIRARFPEIGRASCRERVQGSVAAGAWERHYAYGPEAT